MKRSIVVKALAENIVLTRLDSGDLLSLSIPCRRVAPGTLLLIDGNSRKCPIAAVDGKRCQAACRRARCAVVIEHTLGDSYVPPSDADAQGPDQKAI